MSIQQVRQALRDRLQPIKEVLAAVPGLPDMFEQCFMNTLDTTVQWDGENTFVITGDIPAMWLRDSTAQVLHYLRFADVPGVRDIIRGLIKTQVDCILYDPYANAFNKTPHPGWDPTDLPKKKELVWERKYEIDSLCYPVWLMQQYAECTGQYDFLDENCLKALRTIVDLFRVEQRHEDSDYYFIRTNCPPSDTLSHDGRGAPVGYTGMTWCGFRPSDDACQYGYLVPSNLFAAHILAHVAGFADRAGDEQLAQDARKLHGEIHNGVRQHGIVQHPTHGSIYAYEVDGLGNHNLMDDANVPSLLSLPYLCVCAKDDPLYLATRAFVLSPDNPYYSTGKYACGIGSPHTPPGYIWHIALSIQAMTATDLDEVTGIVSMILNTHAGTGFMHEGFNPDDPAQFTRPWFAWANSLFGELIYRLYEAGTLPQVLEGLPSV
ncbi:MAG: glycoside hydrolase family 125 protein [Christensenellales bacterium]|jgi:meiotically up-regulated gene 157 (Mug157) protein